MLYLNEPILFMKKQITFLIFAFGFIGFVLLTSETNDSSGKAGSTGANGEQTCAQSGCHSDHLVDSGPGSADFTSSMTGWNMNPEQLMQ